MVRLNSQLPQLITLLAADDNTVAGSNTLNAYQRQANGRDKKHATTQKSQRRAFNTTKQTAPTLLSNASHCFFELLFKTSVWQCVFLSPV